MEDRVSKLSMKECSTPESLISIEGGFGTDECAQLQKLIKSCAGPTLVTLDLSGLVSVDQEAKDYLARLQRDGCLIIGASLYIKCLLDGG